MVHVIPGRRGFLGWGIDVKSRYRDLAASAKFYIAVQISVSMRGLCFFALPVCPTIMPYVATGHNIPPDAVFHGAL